jgi:putative endopeptidase
VKADFAFYKKVLDGQQDDKPRWKKMLGLLDRAVGEALGELYVKEVRRLSGHCIVGRASVFEDLIESVWWSEKRLRSSMWRKYDFFPEIDTFLRSFYVEKQIEYL